MAVEELVQPSTVAGASSPLKMPKRTTTVAIPEYPGFEVQLWVNFPQRLAADMQAGDTARAVEALGQIVVAHNGWCDENGEPLPQPADPAFWDRISNELALVIVSLVSAEAERLPKSLATRRT